MKINKYIWLVRKNIFNLINFFLMIFLILCLTGLILGLNLKVNMNEYISGIKNGIYYRLLNVSSLTEEEVVVEDVMNIEHIIANYEVKYLYGMSNYIAEFKNENLDGNIIFEQMLDEDSIKIVNGRNLNEDESGYVICATNFYPSGDEDNINFEYAIPDKELIGQKFSIEGILEVEVVGTFDNANTSYTKNTCILTYEDTKKIRDIKDKDEDFFTDNYAIAFLVDEGANVEKVIEEIAELGYFADNSIDFDDEDITILNNIFNIIITTSSIGIILMMIFYIKMKMNHYQEKLLLYKYLGFKNREIIKVISLENLFIGIIVAMGSVLIYLLIDYLILHKFWPISGYYGLYFTLHLQETVLIIVVFIILLLISTYFYSNKIISKEQ